MRIQNSRWKLSECLIFKSLALFFVHLLNRHQVGTGYYAELSGKGIYEAEKRNLISKDKVDSNYLVRFQILDFAAKAEIDLENDGWAEIDEAESAIAVRSDHSGFDFNFYFLKDIYLITEDSGIDYRINESGTRNLEKWRDQLRVKSEYERVSSLAPQTRGREFEKLITEIVQFAGWKAERDVRTSNEQMDVIIQKASDFYLIECKWEKDPIESAVVNELLGKIIKREGMKGILFSASGFSTGAVENVESLSGVKSILLFGENDLENLISNPSRFETLLDEKIKGLLSQRRIIYE